MVLSDIESDERSSLPLLLEALELLPASFWEVLGKLKAAGVVAVFVACEDLGGEFVETVETEAPRRLSDDTPGEDRDSPVPFADAELGVVLTLVDRLPELRLGVTELSKSICLRPGEECPERRIDFSDVSMIAGRRGG